MRTASCFVSTLILATTAGCQTTSLPVTGPARINHPVFFALADPAHADELIADCDRSIPTIPGVVAYHCGRPLDSGRTMVELDFDVGLYVGFRSHEDYAGYLEHPKHVALVEKWRPRMARMRAHDFLDE